MKHTRRSLWLLAFILPTAMAPIASGQENLLPPIETQGENAWQSHVWQAAQTDVEFSRSNIANTGDESLVITAKNAGADASYYVEIPVEPNTMYRLSGWIKTDNVQLNGGVGALLNLHNLQGVRTQPVAGTKDWTEVSAIFNSGNHETIWVNCLFGGWGRATGTAYYDDIRVEEVSLENLKPTVAINADEQAEPMPVYIYGQFIEHLGRCIDGGIWAEMLEDRKFYYPVGSEESPWKVVGDAKVVMDKEAPFVGEHTPVIECDGAAASHAIEQDGLALVKGREYVLHVWLRAEGDVANAVVSIQGDAWGSNNHLAPLDTDKYKRFTLDFEAYENCDNGRLFIEAGGLKTAEGTGKLYIGAVSLMPADNIDGMRADTLKLLKELNSPVYRWPGGNFVSGYDWRDGVGPRDRRPPRKNPAWRGVEYNDFGLDEFMTFCKYLDTEPYIAVNTGLGGVENAVAELEYANGPADTPMGKLRAENGHPEPYNVKWWGIGNEMYGGWQLGHMPLEDYIKKHNVFAEAFIERDPLIKLVAVGETGHWSEGMMQHSADHMDLISEHFYCQDGGGLISHVQQIPNAIRRKSKAHRNYRERFDSLKGKDIRIAMDEWNYWYGPHVYGELGTRYFLKDALGIAAGINEFARNTDIVFMANYAQTVNVIGCIKTNKTDAAFATTGLVLKLYREKFGTIPVATKASWPLDVQAALTEDGKRLTVSVVNPTMQPFEIPLSLDGIAITGDGAKHEIAGDDPMAYNSPGEEPNVEIVTTEVQGVTDTLTVKPCSVTLFVLDTK